MTAADRLRRIQEIHSESSSFVPNQSLPQTVIGQCIVSYRKFVECISSNYGWDAFDVLTPIETCVSMKLTYKSKELFNIQTVSPSIMDAIKTARYALKHSRHDFLSVNIRMYGISIRDPIITYAAEAKRGPEEFCKILELKRVKTENHKI